MDLTRCARQDFRPPPFGHRTHYLAAPMTVDADRALRTVTATRYVMALREGGSLPGLVEADDDGMYVMKFRGAGQGPGALVAEVVAGELARALGMPVPELVVATLEPELARAEPDPEIQELAQASVGANLGVDFLPGRAAVHVRRGGQPRPRDRRRHRLVRRADHQRRPHAPQPQPARVAPPHLADRPRRRVLPPARRRAAGRLGPGPLPPHPRPRADRGRRTDRRRRRRGWPPRPRRRSRTRSRRSRTSGWATTPDARRADFEAFLTERLTEPREFVAEAESARP